MSNHAGAIFAGSSGFRSSAFLFHASISFLNVFLLMGSHSTVFPLPVRNVVDVLWTPDTRLIWLFLENAVPSSKLKITRTKRGHPFFFWNPPKQMRTTLVCFKQLCGPAELICYPGSPASSSYGPFITCFQWLPPSRLRLEGQVGCRVVHNVWGISNQRSAEARALRPGPPFTPSRGGELQQWPRSTSPARQEVTGKEPWEPAACSVLIAG